MADQEKGTLYQALHSLMESCTKVMAQVQHVLEGTKRVAELEAEKQALKKENVDLTVKLHKVQMDHSNVYKVVIKLIEACECLEDNHSRSHDFIKAISITLHNLYLG